MYCDWAEDVVDRGLSCDNVKNFVVQGCFERTNCFTTVLVLLPCIIAVLLGNEDDLTRSGKADPCIAMGDSRGGEGVSLSRCKVKVLTGRVRKSTRRRTLGTRTILVQADVCGDVRSRNADAILAGRC